MNGTELSSNRARIPTSEYTSEISFKQSSPFISTPFPLYSRKYAIHVPVVKLFQWYSKVSGVCVYIDASNFISPRCNCIRENFLLNAKRVRSRMKEKKKVRTRNIKSFLPIVMRNSRTHILTI